MDRKWPKQIRKWAKDLNNTGHEQWKIGGVKLPCKDHSAHLCAKPHHFCNFQKGLFRLHFLKLGTINSQIWWHFVVQIALLTPPKLKGTTFKRQDWCVDYVEKKKSRFRLDCFLMATNSLGSRNTSLNLLDAFSDHGEHTIHILIPMD